MNVIRWIIGFCITVAITLFAISNRHTVEFYVNPTHTPLEIPLYAIGLGLLAFGFILGSLMTWLNGASIRKSKRKQRKHIKQLEKTLEAINENGKTQNPPSDFFPALPKRVKK